MFSWNKSLFFNLVFPTSVFGVGIFFGFRLFLIFACFFVSIFQDLDDEACALRLEKLFLAVYSSGLFTSAKGLSKNISMVYLRMLQSLLLLLTHIRRMNLPIIIIWVSQFL